MRTLLCSLVVSSALLVTSAFGQYKAESAGAPPSDLPAAAAALLSKEGTKIVGADGKVFAELWLRASLPKGTNPGEENLTLPEVPHGAVLGVMRVPAQIQDRRGSSIRPGTYLLRYSFYPVNGAHQGVAPQRDFLVLSGMAEDADVASTPNFKVLMATSIKSSGQPHPNVLSLWKQDTEFTPGFAKQGEHDWVLQGKIGDTPVAIILVGQAEA